MSFNENLRVGLIGEAVASVTNTQTARALGSGNVDVYATPSMIALMEAAAVNAVDINLLEGQATVGISVNVRHTSATPMGEQITAMAEVTHLDGKRITFQVRAWDEHELIGEGVHTRYIINVEQFMDRLDKAAIAAAEEPDSGPES